MTPTIAEKKYFHAIDHNFGLVIKDLTAKNRINPNHVKELREMRRMFNSANQSVLHSNYLDGIVRIPEERKAFEKKNSDFDHDLLDELWFDMLVVATLRDYWAIEMSLITLLKDVQYGKDDIVQGKENLGKLKKILENIGIHKQIDWGSIDITFRNSLAHGWFYRNRRNFVFYNNAKLRNGKNYSEQKLLYKCRLIQLNAICIAGNVGKFLEMKDFGSKDPLKRQIKS